MDERELRLLASNAPAVRVLPVGDGADRVVLRRAVSGDVPGVAAIERASFSDPWSARAFLPLVREVSTLFLVAASSPGDEILGYAIVWFVGEEAELANIAVSADARRRGIGAIVLEHVIGEATLRGCRTMYLEVRESNAAARSLYARYGFEQVGRRKRYYVAPQEDALVLRKEL
jgi:[ribosomal protein S18]-alanine N-acetyltransferase